MGKPTKDQDILVGLYNQQFQGTIIVVFDFQGEKPNHLKTYLLLKIR